MHRSEDRRGDRGDRGA